MYLNVVCKSNVFIIEMGVEVKSSSLEAASNNRNRQKILIYLQKTVNCVFKMRSAACLPS